MRSNVVRTRLCLGVALAAVAAVVATSASGVTSGGRLTTIAGRAGGGSTSLPTPGKAIPAKSAYMYTPWALAVDGQGNVYFQDNGSHQVHKVSAGRITQFGFGGPNISLAVDRQGNVYELGGVVRKVTPGGTITIFAGLFDAPAGPCSRGDGGPATAAVLCFPRGVAVDGKGNLYITESARVRKVSRDGTITTIAGTGKGGFSGDGGPATRARLSSPGSVAADLKGNVYFCDAGRVRKVSRSGIITTFSPKGCGVPGEADNGLAVDRQGNVYVANGDVYKVTPGGRITTFVGAPSLVVDGRRVSLKPGELSPEAVAYGRGTLFIATDRRIFKATAR